MCKSILQLLPLLKLACFSSYNEAASHKFGRNLINSLYRLCRLRFESSNEDFSLSICISYSDYDKLALKTQFMENALPLGRIRIVLVSVDCSSINLIIATYIIYILHVDYT